MDLKATLVTTRHRARLTTITLAAFSALLVLASSTSHATPAATRTLDVTDEAHLHLVRAYGSNYIEQGQATGALPGTIKVNFSIGATVSGTFTIYPKEGGSISGDGTAQLRSTGTYASFGGHMTVSQGTGRYTHAHGHGGFYGTVDRRTSAIVIQTTGRLEY